MKDHTQHESPVGSCSFGRRAHRVCDLPLSMRPREEIQRRGVEAVSDVTLIAALLRVGCRGRNVVEVAESLLGEHRSLTALARLPMDALARFPGMGKVKAMTLKAALELARRLTEEMVRDDEEPITSPARAAALLREDARRLDREKFWVFLLDVKNRLIKRPVEVFTGSLDGCPVHPREIFKEAVASGSASVILAHNHPSGDPTPSGEDIRMTRQMVEAGHVVGIPVLDHVILGCRRNGESDFRSLRESRLVSFEP